VLIKAFSCFPAVGPNNDFMDLVSKFEVLITGTTSVVLTPQGTCKLPLFYVSDRLSKLKYTHVDLLFGLIVVHVL